MNKAKTTINENKEKKKAYHGSGSMPLGKTMRNILIGIGILTVIVMIVMVCLEQFERKWILKVDDQTVYLDEMTYYIYSEEQNASMYDSLYQQIYGVSYWDYENEDGTTGTEQSRSNILSTVTQEQILYKEATNAGYSISDEDKETAKENVKEVLESLTKRETLKKGLSESDITAIYEKQAMIERYRDDIIAEANIDYDAIKEDIKYEDYRQYDVQYYYVGTVSTDEEGNETKLSDSEKKERLQKMEAILQKAKDGTEFESLIDDNEELIEFTKDASFTKTDSGNIDEDVETTAMKLKNDEISDIIEGSNGYYLVKMIDNNSKESYNDEIETKTTEKEDEVFNEKYQEMINKYNIEVNQDQWEQVKLGSFIE